MKQKFSTKWKASKQPRKQRKYLANAPLHLKRKQLSVNLAKPLREKYNKRNILIRKGDKVKIMVGKGKKKTGKVIEVKTKLLKIYIEGMQKKKTDGSKVNIPFKASNLQIVELNLEDKKRIQKLGVKEEKKKTETPKKEDSKELNKAKKKNGTS